MTSHRSWSREVLVMTLAALLTLSSSSCATYHAYQIGGPDGRELGNQASTEWKGKTLNAFAWGLVRQDLAVDVCRAQSLDGKGGFEEVKIETNALYILASVVTLGIWIPLKVSYRCAKPSSPTGTLGGGR